MKNTIIISALAICSLSINVYSQEAFTKVSLDTKHNSLNISFTLPSEANVTYYRIEAGKDTASFDIISRVHSLGNTVLARTYSCKIYNDGYTYYRVCKVGMNGTLQYSDVINTKILKPNENIEQNAATVTKAYVTGR
jgi:hypothetical protein